MTNIIIIILLIILIAMCAIIIMKLSGKNQNQNTNEILETVSFTNENLLEKINYILTKYKNIKDIDIYGNVAYNEQLKKQISEFELNKFNINKIQINLIKR